MTSKSLALPLMPLIFLQLLAVCPLQAEEARYFPGQGADWERVDPASVGWNRERLNAALELAGERGSSGVLILHRGRILAERYWEPADDSTRYRNMVTGRDAQGRAIEDVASAQKSVVAVLTGMAQERGYLDIDDPVSQHLGAGWSQLSPSQESAVSIRHLLSMNSGLATDFSYAGAPGTRWLYNTPVYHQLMRVLVAATGMDRDRLTRDWVAAPLGMEDTAWTARPWASSDIAVGLSTTARDLARFGLMIMAQGQWGAETLIGDRDFVRAMLSPSQRLNPAYGYLWWLNGKEFSRATGAAARRLEGPLIANAPADLVAMQGALDRKLYLLPSLGLTVSRLGGEGSADGVSFNEAFWEALMRAAPPR